MRPDQVTSNIQTSRATQLSGTLCSPTGPALGHRSSRWALSNLAAAVVHSVQ